MTNTEALAELARRCDVVTFEFENVPLGAAHGLAGGATPLHPPARALEVAQDRLTEKNFLNGLGIATARFHFRRHRAGCAGSAREAGGRRHSEDAPPRL